MLVIHPVFCFLSYILPRDPPEMAQVQQSFEQNLQDMNENLPWAFGEGELTLSLSTSLGWVDLCSLLDFSFHDRNL